MTRLTALKLDTAALERRGAALGRLNADTLGTETVAALNEVLDGTYEFARDRMLAGINLTDDYLRRKVRTEPATLQRPVAEITAEGTQTLLSEYRAVQHDQQVRWTNAKIAAAGHKFGKWPGWTRRTGNQRLGIAADRKSAGISAAPTSTRTNFAHAFAIAGKKDGSGNQIMFTRSRTTGKIRALLGPAVYQLFAYQLDQGPLLQWAEDELVDALVKRAQALFEKAIEE